MKDAKKKRSKNKRRHAEALSTKLEVSLETNIATVAPGCSWVSAFAAAAQIKPAEGLDDEEFLKRTEASQVDSGLAKISQLAASTMTTARAEHTCLTEASNEGNVGESSKRPALTDDSITVKSHKRKREDDSTAESDSSSEEEPPSLEGRMVSHPHKSEEVMVLIDSKRRLVYDAMKRTASGNYLRVGSLVNGDICWNSSAFSKQGKFTTFLPTLCMYRSRRFLPYIMACVWSNIVQDYS